MNLPAGYVQDPLFEEVGNDVVLAVGKDEPIFKQRSFWSFEEIERHPLRVNIAVSFARRAKRSRCAICSKYRVVFFLRSSLGDESSNVCAKCAGIR